MAQKIDVEIDVNPFANPKSGGGFNLASRGGIFAWIDDNKDGDDLVGNKEDGKLIDNTSEVVDQRWTWQS